MYKADDRSAICDKEAMEKGCVKLFTDNMKQMASDIDLYRLVDQI